MTGKYVYSWGGGNINGASHGSIQPKYRKCDDRKVLDLIVLDYLYMQFIKELE